MATAKNTGKTFNGHKNWNHWNVSLWMNNDQGLYNVAYEIVRATKSKQDAAESFYGYLVSLDVTHTPDGAPYSVTTIKAAMRGMEE